MGAIGANATFSASLSSLTTTGIPTNLPAIMPNTTYYFAAWSNVGGTWYPGAVLNFKTASTTVGGGGDHGSGGGGNGEGIENENENSDHGNTGNTPPPVTGGENGHGNNGHHNSGGKGKDN
jgi:hypothetical protein